MFFPSYEQESAAWQPSNRTIRFKCYDRRLLRVFWNYYRQDSTYNLAQRNCSVAVSMALEAALTGSLRGSWPLLRFLRLLCHHDLWVAAFIRRRAEDMTWTPGLVLDYATALARVLEKEGAEKP